ncbi:short chain dehydrogenase [Nesterenkonia ebinurensis]|uniref:short chain dehydrogenase n=1 Tax=Nesterenkonia ebinurensis TaxID=2608252 RepID=UPI00123E3445|nr:short chain dehydrogenase [Nesterenkonia ebinurensis]
MKIVIVGGTGHVGQAAGAVLGEHHEIVSLSRSSDPPVDITEPATAGRAFQQVGMFDALIIAAGKAPFKLVTELSEDDYLSGLQSKVIGQVSVAAEALDRIYDGGSVTLTSGIIGREQIAAGAASAMANGALEHFVKAAAVEYSRGIRLNIVSPNVLSSAEKYHAFFPGFEPVSDRSVGLAYRRAVEGVDTGKVFVL